MLERLIMLKWKVLCDEIINAVAKLYSDALETVSIYLNEEKATSKMDNWYISVIFLFVNILFLKIVIFCSYFAVIINCNDFDLDNISLDERSFRNF